jgi:hypothetical protein
VDAVRLAVVVVVVVVVVAAVVCINQSSTPRCDAISRRQKKSNKE